MNHPKFLAYPFEAKIRIIIVNPKSIKEGLYRDAQSEDRLKHRSAPTNLARAENKTLYRIL